MKSQTEYTDGPAANAVIKFFTKRFKGPSFVLAVPVFAHALIFARLIDMARGKRTKADFEHNYVNIVTPREHASYRPFSSPLISPPDKRF